MLPHRPYAQTVTGPFVYALAMPDRAGLGIPLGMGKWGSQCQGKKEIASTSCPFSVYPGKICQEIILILRRQEGGCITHLEMFLFTYSSKC